MSIVGDKPIPTNRTNKRVLIMLIDTLFVYLTSIGDVKIALMSSDETNNSLQTLTFYLVMKFLICWDSK